ncbi:UNVERIFIED_CONTAM: hypothetical protein NCL1_35236 [Trichonephila clavipes]
MTSAVQSKPFLYAKMFSDSFLTVTPHKPLNSCHGVISETVLSCASEADNLEGLSDQDAHFHSNVEELLNYFPGSILPVEYGGDLKENIDEDWLRKANKDHENYATFIQ